MGAPLSMRRSRQVLAPLLASTAVALLTGCHRTEMQRCVDENNHVVDPSFCKDLPPNSSQPHYSPGSGTGILFLPHVYRYYYGGGGSYTPGTIVTGGGYAPSAGHSYSTTTGTSRGGFGGSFSSSGSHTSGSGE